jgi:predicted RNA binding protein YcfA (HicA-like mRNA interferase family)
LVRLANISGKKAVKAFEKLGYIVARKSGSHIILKHPNRPTLTIPDHKELAPGLLRAIVSQAGVSVNDFLSNL